MIRAIIVDDETKARETLAKYIITYCPSVEIVAEAGNINDAFEVIREKKPDLVFLDVEMPGGNGFDLLEKFDSIRFEIIFTTAHGHYALRAIEHSALDYLLKPVSIERLRNAVRKVEMRQGEFLQYEERLNVLLQNVKAATTLEKIAIPDIRGLMFVNKNEIIRLESDQNYTRLYLTENRKTLSTKPIREYEEMLQYDHFFRVHNSHIVNLNHIMRYEKGEGGTLILSDSAAVEVSRRRKNSLLEKIARK